MVRTTMPMFGVDLQGYSHIEVSKEPIHNQNKPWQVSLTAVRHCATLAKYIQSFLGFYIKKKNAFNSRSLALFIHQDETGSQLGARIKVGKSASTAKEAP